MPRTPEQFENIRSERRKAILDAALHIFAEEGYHSASISKVSKYAGISKGLIYNYFKSKEELLKILISSLLDEETDIIKSILEKSVGEESLIEIIQRTTKILKKHPKKWKLYFAMTNQPQVLEMITEKYSSKQTLFFKKFLEFFKNKGFENPEMQMQYFATTFGGMKISYIMDPDNYPIDQIEQLIIKQFITS